MSAGLDSRRGALNFSPHDRGLGCDEQRLVDRLADAGWHVVDRVAGEDVAITIRRRAKRHADELRTYRGPRALDALQLAVEEVCGG